MENKKYYTFINTQNCIGNDNKTYVGVTAILNISGVELKQTPTGIKVASGRAAINNRTKTLSNALGVNVVETDGTVWTDINVWQDRAERFAKYVGERKTVKLCIVGQLTIQEFPRNDGSKGQRVIINVNDWAPVGSTSHTDGNNQNTPATAAQGFEEIPAPGDDDLPY